MFRQPVRNLQATAVSLGHVSRTPSKRLFLSIIADYDLNRAICELVDNGLDVWVRGGKTQEITIKITLDKGQQTIKVEDNAGGLPKSEIRYIVGPGQTGTSPTEETIGIFGVGTKRAVVALAQDIKIRTRYPHSRSPRCRRRSAKTPLVHFKRNHFTLSPLPPQKWLPSRQKFLSWLFYDKFRP